MKTELFDYDLPQELIAQQPAAVRDESRLLVVDRGNGAISHRKFSNFIDYLHGGDVVVMNDSKVIPARLWGRNIRTGGEFEMLLLDEHGPNDWWAMMRPAKRARVGTRIALGDRQRQETAVVAEVTAIGDEGHRRLRFAGTEDLAQGLETLGEVPLPPYIKRGDPAELRDDFERYQTVYARAPGSVAAPTAGLHFTAGALERVRNRGARVVFVTLHVGLGTFAPVKADRLEKHAMHAERFEIGEEALRTIDEARRAGHRVFAVGTTSLRVLETVARTAPANPRAGAGRTRLFVYPPYAFGLVDALLTNFHLPKSTLLMLVSAFAAPGRTTGLELIRKAYTEAIERRYRFFSYGDAMLLV